MVFRNFANIAKMTTYNLSIENKITIYECLDKGSSKSKITCEYNISASKSTVSDIYKSSPSSTLFKSSLLNENNAKKQKTMKQAANVHLDKAVYMWFVQKCYQG